MVNTGSTPVVVHPHYHYLLVIGDDKSLELWNTFMNKRMNVPAHESAISALAMSSSTKIIASASHEKSLKFWT
ncbi:unnamed protein product [Arabis nemorensis]|uniref:Uncharacterized protein n=1 Tax=Arabis nemorensis TaxID=586526 RepID=A0A565ALV7_9BRAS|nr:unnamed protein product [Arabis nemorensis]